MGRWKTSDKDLGICITHLTFYHISVAYMAYQNYGNSHHDFLRFHSLIHAEK